MATIPYIIFATAGVLICALLVYGYRRAQKLGIKPEIRSVRETLAETMVTGSTYTHRQLHWILLHSVEHISHAVHHGSQALHAKTRSLIRSSFFPHKEVHNRESMLQALMEKKKAIEADIENLSKKIDNQ